MDFKKICYEVVILIWNGRNFTNRWPEVNSAFSYFQFFSTLFAPLGFFADKMESFMPSSFWHQLTRIWPCLTQTQCIHTHTHTHQYHSKPLNKKCFLSCLQHYCPLAALLLITVCWLKLYQHSNTTSKMLSHTLPIVSFSKNTFGEYHLQQFHRVIHFC